MFTAITADGTRSAAFCTSRGDANAENTLYHDCMSADAATVARRALEVGIEWTIVSPLLGLVPRKKASAAVGNDEAFKLIPQTPGLRQWVIVNPLQPETYAQAEVMLKAPWCMGIKIHPEEHGYPIREHGRAVFEVRRPASGGRAGA